jgi:hypothetical protein
VFESRQDWAEAGATSAVMAASEIKADLIRMFYSMVEDAPSSNAAEMGSF